MSKNLIKALYISVIALAITFSNLVMARHNHTHNHKHHHSDRYTKKIVTKTRITKTKITKYSKNFYSRSIKTKKTKVTATYIYNNKNISSEKAAVAAWVTKHSCSKSTRNVYQIVNSTYNYSIQKGLDPKLVIGQMKQESCFNSKARSFAGARGLLQVIPRWHREKIRGRNLYNVPVAIDVGTSVLKEYMSISRQNTCKALRTYSGGANNYCRIVMNNRTNLNKFIYSYRRYNVANN